MIKANGVNDISLESAIISTSAETGLGALVEIINKNSNDLLVRAKAVVELTGEKKIDPNKTGKGEVLELEINGVKLGVINDIQPNDRDNKIIAAINNTTADTGVTATINGSGRLELITVDGRGVKISADSGFDILGIPGAKDGAKEYEYYGRLTLIRNDARDIIVKAIDPTNNNSIDADSIGFGAFGSNKAPAETVINLRAVRGIFTKNEASAMGAHASKFDSRYIQTLKNGTMATGVTTFTGAQTVIDVADTATRMLDKIRSDLGSVQIQLEATVNNITATATNIRFSESQIRDVDYSSEISNFKKNNILAQAGNYALSQSQNVSQGVLKLLQ
jgi:flagellin